MRLVYRGINGDQNVETVVPPDKIVQNSLVITDNICSGGRFHTGGVISKMMSIKLIDNDYNPSYSDIVIRQKYILEDSRTVVFPMGTFEVSAESVRKERMFTSFEGYDYLVKLDKEISDADKRDFDSIVSSHLIDLPLYLYIEFAAEKCGLAIDSAAFEALASFGWTLLTNPKSGASRSAPFTLYRARLMGATYRDLVSSVAALAGCAIKLDREGRLTPVSFLPKTPDKTFTADNSISRSINDKWSVIHFVTYASWQSYRSGDFETGETIYDEATLSLPSNVLLFDSVEDYNEATYAEYVVQKAVDQETTGITSDLKLINAEIKYFGDPGLDAGDYVVSQQNWLDTHEVGFWVMEHVWKPHQPCIVRAFGAPSSSTYASGRDYGQATRTTRVNTTTSEEVIALQNQVSVSTSCSTGEHSVGKWLDGYTLYEKTYYFESLGALSVQQALEIENLRSVVESRGQLIGEGYSMPIPIVPVSSDGESLIPEDAVTFKVDTQTELLIVEHGATDRSSEQAYITLKYTRNAPATIPTVYGFHIDPSISDPAQAVTYLADAVGKTPAAMGASTFSYGDWADAFFMPKPCMLRSDGTVAYYLNPNDYTQKLGTTAEKTSAAVPIVQGNVYWNNGTAGEAPTYNSANIRCRMSAPQAIPPHTSIEITLSRSDVRTSCSITDSRGYYVQRKTSGWASSTTYKNTTDTTKYILGSFAFSDPTLPITPSDFTVTMTSEPLNTDIANSSFDGNAMMEWPLIWYKFEGPKTYENLVFHRLYDYLPDLANSARFAVSEPVYLEAGAYSLLGFGVINGTSDIVIQKEDLSQGIFASEDGYYHISESGYYRYQVNKLVNYANYTDEELERLGASAKIVEAEGSGYFYCSDKQVDSSYKCWCNINSQNEITEHFYTAIYNGTGISKMRSLSGYTLTNDNGMGTVSPNDELTRARANNTTTTDEWYIDVWSDRQLISALLVLMGKSLDVQSVFGKGQIEGGETAQNNATTGDLDDKGLFYGSTTDGRMSVKVFGMENWWGTTARMTAGLIGAYDGYLYKLTYGTADGTTANGYNNTGSGYKRKQMTRPSVQGGIITKMLFGEFGYLPTAAEGTDNVYYTDRYISGNYGLIASDCHYSTAVGTFGMRFDVPPNQGLWLYGAALSCKPVGR